MKVGNRITAFLFVIMIFLILLLSVSWKTANAVVSPSEPAVKLINGTEIVIAQITDLGYYPISYCFSGDFSGTTYRTEILAGTTIFMESSVIIQTALDQIAKQKPDYLVVTGNLTRNGEALGHIEISNMLRVLQNKIRIDKPNFQIFVVPGSNDLYNNSASRYDHNGEPEPVATVNRKEFSRIYAGLGFPSITDTELIQLYNSIEDISIPENAFENPNYSWIENSNNVTDISFKYQFQNIINETDYNESDLTYVAKTKDGRVFFCVDDILTDGGGRLAPESKTLLESVISNDTSQEKKYFAVFHYNVMSHLNEGAIDSLVSGSTLYNAKDVVEYLANKGIRYVFSGHTGANDINSYVSFNGNMLIETTTAGVTGYKGGTRYITIESGKIQSNYAENYFSDIRLVGSVDFTKLVDGGYISVQQGSEYINVGGVEKFITLNINNEGKLIYSCSDVSEFAATKMFRNMLSSYIYTYINPDMLDDLYLWFDGVFKQAQLDELAPYAKIFTENIIDYLEEIVLSDYTPTTLTGSAERGQRLTTYLTSLANDILEIKIDPNERTTLASFVMDSYLVYKGGVNVTEENASEELLDVLNKIEGGSVVKTFMEYLLYGKRRAENTGLMRIINGLMTTPIDVSKGMDTTDIQDIESILSTFSGVEVKLNSIYLEDLVAIIIRFIDGEVQDIFNIGSKTLSSYINYALQTYFSEDVYTGLKEYLLEILRTLNFDETPDGGFSEKQIYRISGSVTYKSEKFEVEPTTANGRLPSMLTITFGNDPATTKNFVWFTDKNITDTVVKYKEGSIDSEKEFVTVSGSMTIKGVYSPATSFGVLTTYTETELGRHMVSLTKLKPGTNYSYMAGSAIDDLWVEGTFKTDGGVNDPFDALLLTDIAGFSKQTFTDAAMTLENIKGVFGGEYDFVINAGNSTNDGRNIREYEYFLNGMSNIWKNTTMAPVSGVNEQYNYVHDSDGIGEQWSVSADADKSSYNVMQLYYEIVVNNNQNPVNSRGIYYSFDYGPVHFVVINTNDVNNRYLINSTQETWLKNDLFMTDKSYKVVIMNRSIISQGLHGSDTDMIGVRWQLQEIFADSGVNLVLQGNDRAYSESYYLDSNGKKIDNLDPIDGVHEIGTGTLYVNLGTISNRFSEYVYDDSVPIAYISNDRLNIMKYPTYGRIWFDGEKLYYAGYKYDQSTGESMLLRIYKESASDEWERVLLIILATLIPAIALIMVFFLIARKTSFFLYRLRPKKENTDSDEVKDQKTEENSNTDIDPKL
ncbi:MAG: metallophosphoesterase [Christensenellaceae bacterium]|jgi:hypothetical protein|nr:metallophosphoesterase [Christensenellaceae bacterium]